MGMLPSSGDVKIEREVRIMKMLIHSIIDTNKNYNPSFRILFTC